MNASGKPVWFLSTHSISKAFLDPSNSSHLLSALAQLNRARRGQGEGPIRHGLCLHFGQVLYGNVGSSERLDFTIIGQAVNVAARGVEATRTLDTDYLFTRDFVEPFGETGLVPLDTFDFKGVPRPIQLFTFAVGARDTDDAQLTVSE